VVDEHEAKLSIAAIPSRKINIFIGEFLLAKSSVQMRQTDVFVPNFPLGDKYLRRDLTRFFYTSGRESSLPIVSATFHDSSSTWISARSSFTSPFLLLWFL